MCMCVYVCECVSAHVCVCVCTYVCMHTCVCVFVYRTHTHARTHTPAHTHRLPNHKAEWLMIIWDSYNETCKIGLHEVAIHLYHAYVP